MGMGDSYKWTSKYVILFENNTVKQTDKEVRIFWRLFLLWEYFIIPFKEYNVIFPCASLCVRYCQLLVTCCLSCDWGILISSHQLSQDSQHSGILINCDYSFSSIYASMRKCFVLTSNLFKSFILLYQVHIVSRMFIYLFNIPLSFYKRLALNITSNGTHI
jgi:hypothetical protein